GGSDPGSGVSHNLTIVKPSPRSVRCGHAVTLIAFDSTMGKLRVRRRQDADPVANVVADFTISQHGSSPAGDFPAVAAVFGDPAAAKFAESVLRNVHAAGLAAGNFAIDDGRISANDTDIRLRVAMDPAGFEGAAAAVQHTYSVAQSIADVAIENVRIASVSDGQAGRAVTKNLALLDTAGATVAEKDPSAFSTVDPTTRHGYFSVVDFDSGAGVSANIAAVQCDLCVIKSVDTPLPPVADRTIIQFHETAHNSAIRHLVPIQFAPLQPP